MRGSGARLRRRTHAAMSRDIVDDLFSARRVRLPPIWRPQVWRRRECAARFTELPLVASRPCLRQWRCPGQASSAIACAPPRLRQRMTVWALLWGGGLVLGLLYGAAPPRRKPGLPPPRHESGPSSTIRRPTTWLRGCALDLVDAQHPRDHLVELGVVEDVRPVAAHDALSAVVRGSERHDRDTPVTNGATR